MTSRRRRSRGDPTRARVVWGARVGRAERGAATVLVVALTGVLLLVGAALGVVAAMLVDHRQAQAAADLAALAGAATVADGGDGCDAAGDVAARNGATLTACQVMGREVLVEVTVTGPRWLGQRGDLSARARAGPAIDPSAPLVRPGRLEP